MWYLNVLLLLCIVNVILRFPPKENHRFRKYCLCLIRYKDSKSKICLTHSTSSKVPHNYNTFVVIVISVADIANVTDVVHDVSITILICFCMVR